MKLECSQLIKPNQYLCIDIISMFICLIFITWLVDYIHQQNPLNLDTLIATHLKS